MSKAAYGTLLKIGNGAATEVYSTVANVRDITGPSFNVDYVDVTSQSSTGGNEEIAPTIKRPGEISFNMIHNNRETTHSTGGLYGDMTAKTLRNFKLYSPAATATSGYDVLSFHGYVTAFSLSRPLAGEQGADCTIKITGTPAWSTATG